MSITRVFPSRAVSDWRPYTPDELRYLAHLWRTMHASGTRAQCDGAEQQARANERKAESL